MIALEELPLELRILINDAEWEWEPIGMSGAVVVRLHFPDQSVRYLKYVPDALPHIAAEVRHEAEVLRWLHGKLPVPEVIYSGSDATNHSLLTSEIPSAMTCDPAMMQHPAEVVHVLGKGLREIHAISIQGCPFDQRLDRKLADLRWRIDHDLVDTDDFEPENRDQEVEAIYAELVRTRPVAEDLVFSHGDYCLPNVLMDPKTNALTGFVDWARAGVGDRWFDLGIATRSIRQNRGEEWVAPFFAAYGIAPDPARIAFFILLDELY